MTRSKPNQIKLARDARTGATITLDLSRPRAIFVTGKRGSGKTVTLHRFATQAAQAGATIVAIDPLGALVKLAPNAHRLVPGSDTDSSTDDPAWSPLLLNPSDLSTDAWLALFGLSLSKPGGILLSRALRHLRRASTPSPFPPRIGGACPEPVEGDRGGAGGTEGGHYLIPDLITHIEADDRANSSTIEAISNRLEAAHHDWNIFRHHGYQDLADIFTPGLHLVDLSTLDPGPNSLRNLVASLLISRLFVRAQTARSAHSQSAIRHSPFAHSQLILLIDEAHNFARPPALAAKPIDRWAREGRNFNLSLILATQRPSTLPADIISQADIIVIHRLTLVADVKAVGNLASTYARDLAAILKSVRDPGQAIIVDDTAERAVVGHVISE